MNLDVLRWAPPNYKRILVKSNLSRIPTLVGNSNCMKPRCQVCHMFMFMFMNVFSRQQYKIPGTSSTIQPVDNNCDFYSIVYLLMCDKCVSGNDIGETWNEQRFTLNNSKKSIRHNSRGVPVAVLFNQPDHSLENLWCFILWGYFSTTADRLICSQTFNQYLSFLSPYNKYHRVYNLELLRLSTTPIFDAKQWVTLFSIHIYRHYTTE